MPGPQAPLAPSEDGALAKPTPASELAAFLTLRRVVAFSGVLEAQDIATLDEFAELIKDAGLKASLRQAFIDNKAPPKPDPAQAQPRTEDELLAGHRLALAAFDALSAQSIDQDIATFRHERAPHGEARYQATAELKRYLAQEGFPEESVPVFESKGVYSIGALQDLCAGPDKGELENALRQGGVIGGRRYPKSASAADLLKNLSAQEVAAKSKPPIQADDLMSEQAQARRKKIEEAIAKVDEFRESCVGDASANLQEMKQRAETELTAMLERAGVGGALTRLDKGAFASLGALNAALADINKNLGDAIGKELLAAQRGEPPLENAKLVEYNGLRRGVVLTVAGVRDAGGPELVDVAASVSHSNEGYRESIAQFDSESSYQYAEKTVERSSSAFSTSQRITGGGIGQAGLFALSLAGSYARVKYEQKESTAAGRRSQASKLAVRKIEMVSAQARLPRAGARLSREAVEALGRIAREADEAQAAERARAFIAEFGSHLFCEVKLGGCYKSVVRAEAMAEDSIGVLSKAASLAAGWKASGAATYVGLGFLGTGGTANEGDKAQAEGFSKDERNQLKSVRIDISSHAIGGLPGLSADLWKYSLGKNQNWRVIDRLRPVEVWALLRDANADGLSSEQREAVCRRLERSWVRDYFLPDLFALDAGLKSNRALAEADSVAAAVDAVAGLMRAPRLRVSCFRKTFPAAHTMRCALDLPEHYKILSGGAATLQTKEGNFLISSYPSYDPALKRWSWHAQMRYIKHPSSEEHEISVIAVYDPDDEWEVRLFARQSQGLEPAHDLVANAEADYLVTGGGGRIDRFGWATLTQCGFQPEPDAAADAAPKPGYYVASRSCLKDSRHQLTAIAIGLRPRNGTRLVPRYRSETAKKAGHPDVRMTRRDQSERWLGGGVCAHPNGDNFLVGSCPIVDGADGAIGWKGASKDHEKACAVSMTVTTVGVANVEVVNHKPEAQAQPHDDPSQFCLNCGHVGPWLTHKLPKLIAEQEQTLFLCAECRTFVR
ncbi:MULTISPECIES: MAC/perforin domain-containing protein [unclassified Lysobacter]|uniref:MAC/perforin domain-containing protein n=1 Tax=unclassified Lysobacter TaxID=2635362 RepID=UPI0009E92B8D|nr:MULTISPECIES: MAC/perforin domain-containing protein [unclassified Lysobacter]